MFSWLTGNNRIPPPPEPNQAVAETIRKKKYYSPYFPEDFNRSIVKQARKIHVPRQKHFIHMTFLQEEIKQEYKKRRFQIFRNELISATITFHKRRKETRTYHVLHECRLIFVHREMLALFDFYNSQENKEQGEKKQENQNVESDSSEEYYVSKGKVTESSPTKDSTEVSEEVSDEETESDEEFGLSEEYVFPKPKCETTWNENSLFGENSASNYSDIEVSENHTVITIETGNSGYSEYKRSEDEEFFGSFLVDPFTPFTPFESLEVCESNNSEVIFKDFMDFTSLLENKLTSVFDNVFENDFSKEETSRETSLTEKDMQNLSSSLPSWAIWEDKEVEEVEEDNEPSGDIENFEDADVSNTNQDSYGGFDCEYEDSCEESHTNTTYDYDDREDKFEFFDIENQRSTHIEKRERDQKEKEIEQERKLEKQLKKQKKIEARETRKVENVPISKKTQVKPIRTEKKIEKTDLCKEMKKTKEREKEAEMKARREHPEGYLDITLGSMFSGKSTWQTLKLTRMADQRFKCLYINNAKDVRKTESFDDCVTTHNSTYSSLSSKIDRVKVKRLCEVDVSDYDYIAIDEFQFFDSDDTVEIVLSWVQKGKYILVASLDGDCYRRKFGKVLELIPDANEVRKITAYCDICRDTFGELKQAPFTARMTNDTTAELVGGRDMYKAMCRSCHNFHLGITQ